MADPAQPAIEFGQLMERTEQLATLREAVARIGRRSGGAVAVVTGEAGAGKTELLMRFCDDVAGSARVLRAACDALFTPRPLGPLLDVAGVTGGELQEQVAADAAPHDVAATLLEELAGPSPCVLVIEDLHWADEATLDVVRLVARRVERVPVLLVVSYRDEQVGRGHPLKLLLGELPRSRSVTRIEVPALSPEAVAALAEPVGMDAAELYDRTGGNAFFVTEALAAGERRIPESVRDAVLARAARLSAAARSLLDAVAIVPQRTEVWLLEALDNSAAGSLEECLASGMLRAEADGVAFRHELARLAVLESLPPDRRVALHRRALAALERAPTGTLDLARLAHHAEAAGNGAAVWRYAPQAAAHAASLGAHREAAAQYARALRFAEGAPSGERAELLERRWLECFLTDQYDEAIESLHQALRHHRDAGDRRREGDLLRALSQTLWCPGGTNASKPAALEAVEVLEPLPAGREIAMAYANLGAAYKDEDAMEEAVVWASRAIDLGEHLDDPEIRVHGIATVGAIELMTEVPGGIEKLEGAVDLAMEAGLHEQVGRTFVLIGWATVRRRAHSLSNRCIPAGIEYCGDHGLELFRLYLLAYRARSQLDQGKWDDAVESAAAVVRVPRHSTTPRITALVVLGLARARRGDPEHLPPLKEALALAQPTGELQRIGPAAAALAEVAWLRGDHDAVGDATTAALDLARERRSSWVLGELASWRRRAGIPEAVTEAVVPPYATELAGDPLLAAEEWRGLGCPYEAALALADTDEEGALRQAHDELRALGARSAAAIVARRLRARGARNLRRGPHTRTRENAAGLTRRELEVLALVAEGLRNSDISQRLVLSERTVDHHVSAILRKLDVRTRGQAAAAASKLGLLEAAKT